MIAFTIIFATLQLIILQHLFQRPVSLKLGVANDDVQYTQCFNPSTTSKLQQKTCMTENISCVFLRQLPQDLIDLKYFNSFDEAHSQLVKGNIIALLHIKANFSKHCISFLESNDVNEAFTIADKTIAVQADRTLFYASHEVTTAIEGSFFSFLQVLLSNCGKSNKFLGMPIKFETVYGTLQFDTIKLLLPVTAVL